MNHADAQATREIERLKPHHLMVSVEGEDEPKRVNVPAVRNRWARIAAIVGALRWTQIECRDKGGGVLGYVRCADDEPAAPVVAPDSGAVSLRERELVDLVMAACDRAVARALEAGDRSGARLERSLAQVADAMSAQLELMTASTRAVAAQYTEALTLQRSLTLPPPGANGEDEHGIAALAPLLSLMKAGGPKPTAPPAPKKVGKA